MATVVLNPLPDFEEAAIRSMRKGVAAETARPYRTMDRSIAR